MSACLFACSSEYIKKMSTNELKTSLKEWKDVVDKFDWNKFKQCDFDSDMASGYKSNVIKAEAELKMRELNINGELPHTTISGYNPQNN